jgi:hypothetical protein
MHDDKPLLEHMTDLMAEFATRAKKIVKRSPELNSEIASLQQVECVRRLRKRPGKSAVVFADQAATPSRALAENAPQQSELRQAFFDSIDPEQTGGGFACLAVRSGRPSRSRSAPCNTSFSACVKPPGR